MTRPTVPVRGRQGTRLRAEALLSVAAGESKVLDIVEMAGTTEPALRTLKLRPLLAASPTATSASVRLQLSWLALQLGVTSANQPLWWWLHPRSPLRLTLLRTVVERGAPPVLGTVESGPPDWSALRRF